MASNNLFSAESPAMNFLNRLGDIVIISLLFFAFSLPVVTAGASITAASFVVQKALRGDDGYIFKRFWQSFKKNFIQSTIAWFIMAAVGFVLSYDVYFWVQIWKAKRISIVLPLVVLSVILIVLYLMIMVHLFALIGNFENTTKTSIKNALLIGINKFPATIFLILLWAVCGWLLYDNFPLLLIFVIFGFGAIAFIMGMIHKKIFASIMKQQSPVEEKAVPKKLRVTPKQRAEMEAAHAAERRRNAFAYSNEAEEDEDEDERSDEEADDIADKATEDVADEVAEGVADKATEDVADKAIEDASDEVTENVVDDVTE